MRKFSYDTFKIQWSIFSLILLCIRKTSMMSLRTIKILKTLPQVVNNFPSSSVYFEDSSSFCICIFVFVYFEDCFFLVCLVRRRDVSAYIVSCGWCPTKCHHTGLPRFLKSPSSKPSTSKVLSLEIHHSKPISILETREESSPLHIRVSFSSCLSLLVK